MARYFPINVGLSDESVRGEILKVHWEVNGLEADFALSNDENRAIRVRFNRQTIVRILDEMPLSTEDDPRDRQGLVPNHFAYRVEGSTFAATQSVSWREFSGPVSHYEFVTDWGCMDVLCANEPTFELVKVNS